MKKMSTLDEKLKYQTFITPDFVYIPIKASKVSFAPNSYVYDSTLLLIDDDKTSVYSSCSGTLLGTAHVMTTLGRMNAMVIENDFLEKKKASKGTKKRIFNMKSEEMTNILQSFNLDYGFSNKKAIVIIVTYDKKVILNDRLLLKENIVELLEVVDAVSGAYDIEKVVFAVDEEDEVSYDLLKNFTGTYYNFSVTTVRSSLVEGEKITKKLLGNSNKNESVTVYLSDIEAISYALKRKKLLKNKFITISGGPLKNPIVVYTKIGTCVSELLNALKINYKHDDVRLIGRASEKAKKNEGVITRITDAIILEK